jgi:hypothetical protein
MLGFGTIYIDIPLPHGENLSVGAAVLVLHTAHEFCGLTLSPKLQLSVAKRKSVPPTHKGEYDRIAHGMFQYGRWLGQLIWYIRTIV